MSNEINVRDYFDVVIRRWKFVFAMPVLAILAAALVTGLSKPTFQATATIALAPSTVAVSLSNLLPPYYLAVDSPRRLPTAYTPTYYITVLKDAEVVNAAQARAAITLIADSNDRSLIQIVAQGDDPKIVADSANAYAQAGAQRIQRLLAPNGEEVVRAKQKLDAAQDALDQFLIEHHITDYDPALPPALPADQRKQLTQLNRERDLAESVYLEFAREFAQSAILAETAYRPSVILAPVPTAPVAPRWTQNLLLGAAFGLLIGVLGAFLLEMLRK